MARGQTKSQAIIRGVRRRKLLPWKRVSEPEGGLPVSCQRVLEDVDVQRLSRQRRSLTTTFGPKLRYLRSASDRPVMLSDFEAPRGIDNLIELKRKESSKSLPSSHPVADDTRRRSFTTILRPFARRFASDQHQYRQKLARREDVSEQA